MGGSPAITVLVATYKGAFLGETLKSIQDQTLTDFEVLVLDDANQAECRALVERLADERFVYIGNDVPLRPALNHAKGISLARGSRISILNHDDLWTPTVLQKLSAALDREGSAVAAFSRARVADSAGQFDAERTRAAWKIWRCTDYPVGLIPNWFALENANPNFPVVPSSLLRAEALKAVVIPGVTGGMYDAWIGYRIARTGAVYHEDDAVGFWREHSDNLTQMRSAKRSAERIYFDVKLAADSRVPGQVRRAAVRRLPRSVAAWLKDSMRGERTTAR